MEKELLRVFKAVIVDSNDKVYDNSRYYSSMLRNGYLVSNNVQVTDSLLDTIESIYSLSQDKVNKSFHSSFYTVYNSTREELWLHQVIHYLTTYGFESLGIKSDFVYIPVEERELPETKEIAFLFISGQTKLDIAQRIESLDSAGVGLHDDLLNDLAVIIKELGMPFDFYSGFQNREILSIVNNVFDVIPSEPEAWLRSLVYKLTGSSLLIKNSYLINQIKASDKKEYIYQYISNAPNNLASIFYRYKPIFLALRQLVDGKSKRFFNRLRRQAPKQHIPVFPPAYKSITSVFNTGKKVDVKKEFDIEKVIEKASVVDKVKLYNSLNLYQLLYKNGNYRVFRIRNGYYHIDEKLLSDYNYHNIYDKILLDSIQDDLSYLKDKKVYIPEGIEYGFPVTGKQFVNNFPYGTSVELGDNFAVGIYWENYNGYRIDLDLSGLSVGGKIGWNSSYYNESGSAVFSGDMTSAHRGACEALYFNSNSYRYIISSNFYNYNRVIAKELQAQFFLSKMTKDTLEKNPQYLLDKNNIILSTVFKHTHRGIILGLVYGNRFYFFGNNSNKRISAIERDYIYYIGSEALTRMTLNKALKGLVNFVSTPDESDIDLSPDKVTADDFLMLLSEKNFADVQE